MLPEDEAVKLAGEGDLLVYAYRLALELLRALVRGDGMEGSEGT
jgi:hypothetical protein